MIVNPVDLDRRFIPIRPDEPIESDIVEGYWRGHRGTLSWADLLARPRVVILAEANSGKTFEFARQVERIREAGRHAFFAPIEQLADKNLAAVLGRDEQVLFEAWQDSGQTAWWFLDSIDEAKLTHRNIDLALRQFAKDLGAGYQRAHILVSCRGTDWDGEADLKRISTALPAIQSAAAAKDRDEALLARVTRDKPAPKDTADPAPPYTVVSMAAFSAAQRRRFLEEGVKLDRAAAFEADLAKNGLLDLANRPGDLVVLADYWLSKERLGSLTEMMEVSIAARLADRRDRPDASVLTARKAREGVERIAAAMVLGRAVTVKTTRTAGAGVNLAAVLDDWTAADRLRSSTGACSPRRPTARRASTIDRSWNTWPPPGSPAC